MLYEHHYQNFKPGAKSPKANRFLEKHLRDIEWFKENKTSPPPSPPRASTSDDPFLTSLLNDKDKSKPKTRRGRKAAQSGQSGGVTTVFCKKGADGLPTMRWTGPDGVQHELTPYNLGEPVPFVNNQSSKPSFPAPTRRRPLPSSPRRRVPASLYAQPLVQQTVSQKFGAESSARSSTLLARHPEPVTGGLQRLPEPVSGSSQRLSEPVTGDLQRLTPVAHHDDRRMEGLNGTSTPNSVYGTRSYAPAYQGYSAPSSHQPKAEKSSIQLPSIREMVPWAFPDRAEEAVARQQADSMLQSRKRSAPNDYEQMPAQKRRALPIRPTPRQNNKQQSSFEHN
ncbi:hypothetical protein ACHAPT_004106 [Fusarium lateritium]